MLLFKFIVVIQLILHYIGWLGVALGVIAYLFGNSDRGLQLLVGGLGFIVLKYIIGIIYKILLSFSRKTK